MVPIPRLAPRTAFGKVRRKCKQPPPRGRDADKRERVLNSWVDITMGAPTADLMRQCRGDKEEVRKSLSLIFTGKATSTLTKRAAAVRAYQRWFATMDLPGPALPAQEDILFRHLAEVYDECGAATRGQSLLEALNLTCATIGLPSDAQDSLRVKGAAAASFAQKRGTLQRPPLTVQAVRALEDGVTNASCLCDRVFCGFLAFCAHTRTRFLDGARICAEPTIDETDDVSFIETTSIEHKGANRPRVRGLSLPVVGHAIGVRGESWAEAWLEVRKAMGLNATTDGALMLTPSGGDSFTARRLSTTEGAIWLREILIDAGIPPDEASAYGTHSLKATMLSWCAKAGMPKGARRLLGGHAAHRDKSVLEYSRDALAEPLRLLGDVLDKISTGEFHPDATRSGRWSGLAPSRTIKSRAVAHAPTPTEPAASSSDVTGCTSESSAGESSDEPMNEETAVEALGGQDDTDVEAEETGHEDVDEQIPEGGLLQHVRYLTLHARSVAVDGKLVCGRAVSDRYRDLSCWPAVNWNRCKGCFV